MSISIGFVSRSRYRVLRTVAEVEHDAVFGAIAGIAAPLAQPRTPFEVNAVDA